MSMFLFHFRNTISVMREFAKRLKELRTERKLSIAELSSVTGVNVASICRWENNQNDAKGDQLILLAKFFNVTVGQLLGTEELR